ncbi:MAG: pyridoxamine 5'-phosphate oxidase family protein [Cyclobacteriaceae bacterium]|jgi:hypothetical protein|nr:pyridoxamine 5'-phosphate oxidase family protein [Cyclobacteriaceae bacterium]
MPSFPITDKTEITRLAKRGVYDREAIYAILDEALVCTLAYCRDGQPFQIPTGFCRWEDTLYLHGSVGSFYLREITQKNLPISLGVTLMDGLVLARSAFHHSVNYRSVVMFGTARAVTDEKEAYAALEIFTHKMCPGRWADVRKPTPGEWKATMVVAVAIAEASAKVRTGPPKDDAEDYDLDVWAGVQPLQTTKGAPLPDPDLKPGVALPAYLR